MSEKTGPSVFSGSSFASIMDINPNPSPDLEGLCLMSLAQLNGPECRYILQEEVHDRPFIQHYSMEAEWFQVVKNKLTDKWDWSIEVPKLADDTSAGPGISLSGSRDDNGMRTLRHDIVGMALSTSSTDVKLRSVFPQLKGREEGSLSPDYYMDIAGCNIFVELGTTRASDSISAVVDLRKKLFKYSGVLEELDHTKPCLLIVVIVGQRFVVSNYLIDDQLVEKLTYHMSLAYYLELRIAGLNMPLLMAPMDSHEEVVITQIKRQLGMIEVVDCPAENLNITKEFINSLDSPANVDKVSKYFHREVKKAAGVVSVQRQHTGLAEEDPRLISLIETLTTQESKNCVKAVTPMPLFVVPRSKKANMEVSVFVIGGHDGLTSPTIELWSKALAGYRFLHADFSEDYEQRKKELYYTNKEAQKEVEDQNKDRKKDAHRCAISEPLSYESLRQLAMDGVWGKKFQNDREKMDRERLQSLPYHYDTPTDDITNFIANTDLYEDYADLCDEDDPAMDLIEKSYRDLDLRPEAMQDANSITRTKFYCALEISAAIAMELTISLKQHTKKNDVLIKKLAHYNIYLLIVPTKASEHIFFSIWVPKQEGTEILSELPFRSFKPAFEGAMYTDFCSFRQDKLSNHATAPNTFMGLVSYFSYHYHLKDSRPTTLKTSMGAMMMINYTMLVRLENKLPTEEAISVSRYMFMEVLKGRSFIQPDPFRLLCKISPIIRSRLQLFAVRRLLQAFCTMINSGVKRVDPEEEKPLTETGDDDVPSNDHWSGLINPITFSEEKSASEVISTFYIGYAVDKDQIAQQNTDFKLVQKAIKKDLEFNEEESFKSSGMWDDFEDTPSEKQFSPNAIRLGVQIMRTQLIRRYGQGYQEVLENAVLRALASHMTDSVATLKASANIPHVPWASLPLADQALKEREGRLKVLEALVAKLPLFGQNPYMNVQELVQIIESTSRGVISDLFKKNQHAGLREIYVLTIESRLLALLVETYSRTLCKEFSCETMTHPDQKLEVVERHKNLVKRIMHSTGRRASEYQCSADKKSWNNNLVMPALAIPLLMLLPKEMHGSIQRILNLWNERLVKLPNGVLNLLVKGVELSDPTYKVLQMEFESPGSYNGKPLLVGEGGSFCILRRGMMQGILHYTSSLLHVAYLHLTSAMIKVYFQVNFPDTICIIDQMCSSDDSATIFSVLHPKEAVGPKDKEIVVHSELICHALTTFCNYACFTNSEKSTMGSHNHLEFNSEFIIGNTLAVPTLKWVFACYQVSESENLLLRQQTMYNLMSQVSSAGLPSYNTAIVQVSQGLLHYKLLGSETNQFFDVFVDEIKKYPDPSLGFFIVDEPLVMGVNGFSYHHWLHCRVHNMFHLKKRSIDEGAVAFNPEGGLTESFLVRHGDSRRYKEMVERITGGEEIQDLRAKINQNPTILYSPTQNSEEAETKMFAKALAPGTAQSLSRGVPFIQAVAVSIYGLQNYCYTRTDASYDEGKGLKEYNKVSLIGEIARRRKAIERGTLVHDMTWESVCFPNCKRYEDVLIVVAKYKKARPHKVGPIRHKKTRMVFQQATSSIGVSLYDLVKEMWAGVVVRQSAQLKKRAWECYKALMPWLNETIEATLEKSPFMDHVELHNFVSTQAKRARTYVKVGPAIRSTYTIAQMEQLCRKTYRDRTLMILTEQQNSDKSYESFRDRRTSIGLALEIPISSHREIWVKTAARRCPVRKGELTNLKDRMKREAVLAIMTATINNHPREEIKNAVEELGSGLFVSWLTEQEREVSYVPSYKRSWKGKGELILSNKYLYCLVELFDDKATLIKTNSITQLRKVQHEVIASLKEQGIRPMSGTPSRNCMMFLTPKKLDVSGPGTPVIEMKNNPHFTPPDHLDMEFYVTIKHGCLSLMQKGTPLPATVLQYKTLPIEFESNMDGRTFNDVWKAWFNQARLSADVAESFLIQVVKRSQDDQVLGVWTPEKKESFDLIKFARETLLARLRHRGQVGSTYKPPYQDTTEISEVDDPEVAAAMQTALTDCMADIIYRESLPNFGGLSENEELTQLATHVDWAEESCEGLLFSDIAEFLADHGVSGAPVEFVTSRLSTRYGVMQFWDGLIEAVNNLNSNAWNDLVNGRSVAGIVNSSAIVWLLTSQQARPARVFGKSIADSVSEEAMVAIYAKSGKSRSSKRSETSKLQERYASKFLDITEELFKESEKFKGKEELIKDIMTMLTTAREKTDAVLDVEGSSGSLTSSSSSLVSGRTMSPITKVENWVFSELEFGPGESYQAPGLDSMMTSDELNWLFEMIKLRLVVRHDFPESAITLSYYLKGEMEVPADRVFNIDDRMVYFCHTGSSDSGHWVAVVTGMRGDGTMEYFDSLMSDMAYKETLEQMERLFPDDEIKLVRVGVQKQGINSCGHHAIYLSCHRLFGWKLPHYYSDRAVRDWVSSCIRKREIEAPSLKLEA
nr:RNA-dependent RNA polymerase [Fangshan bunya-like virus]